jgi:stress response protein YsnF
MDNESNNSSSSQKNSLAGSSTPSNSSLLFTPTTLHTIPVIEEKPAISKRSVTSNTVIEKRWVNKTELVRVPVTYEEIYVNGKPMSSGKGILSDLKKALSGKNETVKESEDVSNRGEFVPLSATESERVIPVYGEKIIITKKMSKLNDIVIKKRRKVEKKKVEMNITKENVKIKHANGKIENIST